MSPTVKEKVRAFLDEYDEFTPQERRTLTVIITHPGYTLEDLHKETRIKGNSLNRIITTLEKKGFITHNEKTPRQFIPQHPKAIFDILNGQHNLRQGLQRDVETELTQIFEKQVVEGQEHPPENIIELDDRLAGASTWLFTKIKAAGSSIRIAARDFTLLQLSPGLKSELLAKKDQCNIKLLCFAAPEEIPNQLIVDIKSQEIPCKKSNGITVPMIIIDEVEILIALAQLREEGVQEGKYKYVMAHSQSLGHTLTIAFDAAWDRGEFL